MEKDKDTYLPELKLPEMNNRQLSKQKKIITKKCVYFCVSRAVAEELKIDYFYVGD